MQKQIHSLCLCILACVLGAGRAQELTSLDSQGTPDLRAVKETVVQNYGPFNLESRTLQQMQSVGQLPFEEDHWLVGYRVEMTDPAGQKLDRELMCHTFFGSRIPKHGFHDELRGIFSDGYTEEIRLPPGFGIFFKAGEKAVWLPMFNNRNPELANASMKVTLELVPARKASRRAERAEYDISIRPDASSILRSAKEAGHPRDLFSSTVRRKNPRHGHSSPSLWRFD